MGSVQVFPKRRPFTSFYSTDISLRKQKFSAKAAVLFFQDEIWFGIKKYWLFTIIQENGHHLQFDIGFHYKKKNSYFKQFQWHPKSSEITQGLVITTLVV